MVADKLAAAIFTQIVLFIVSFIAVFLYLRTVAIGAIECYLYRHKYKSTTPNPDCHIFITAYFLKRIQNGIPEPIYKFDKHPSSQEVKPLEQAEYLADTQPNSLFFGIVDPPHIISTGDSIGPNGISKIDGSNMVSNRFSCFKNLEELQTSNEYLISLSSKLLAEGGILLYKIQDTVSSGRQIFSHLFVIEKVRIRIGRYLHFNVKESTLKLKTFQSKTCAEIS